MTDENALLMGIAAEPHDDLVRFAYADWMEEQGNPERGEFIRVQCRLAADEARACLEPEERAALREREADLLKAHGAEWAGGAADFKPKFRRGFVERVTLFLWDVETCAQQLQALRKAVPTIAGLELAPGISADSLERLLNHEACRGLRELSLDGARLGVDGLEVVANARELALERLNLAGGDIIRIDMPALAALAASPNMTHLRELDLSRNLLGLSSLEGGGLADPWQPFMAACTKLESLRLENSWLVAHDVQLLVDAMPAETLRRLELGDNYFGNEAVTALAGGGHSFRLRRLGLQNCDITDDGATALAQSAQFSGLESLELAGNRIGRGGARALAASPHLGRLEMLGMGGTRIGYEGVKTLIDSKALGRLHSLNAKGIGRLRQDGGPLRSVEHLAGSEGLARMRSLQLEDTGIDARSLQRFLASPHVAQLRELSLADNPLDAKGARLLAQAQQLARLRTLNLRDCRLGAKGVQAIADCTHFGELRYLDINGNLPEGKLQFVGKTHAAMGAARPMTIGMRVQLHKCDPAHVALER